MGIKSYTLGFVFFSGNKYEHLSLLYKTLPQKILQQFLQ